MNDHKDRSNSKQPQSCHPQKQHVKDNKKSGSRFWKELVKGIIVSNPVFILILGLCPVLAITNSITNALGMGAGVIFVLLCSNILISSIRKATPLIVRIPVFIVVIATSVTILSLVFEAYIPPLYKSLGIYLPLVVVNCIILGRAEAFASKNSVLLSTADAVGIGIGFTIALVIISLIREIIGTGSLEIFGRQLFKLPGLSTHPLIFFISPPGAFLVIGIMMALLRLLGVMKYE
ncbi:MAG: electron transport complex subunit RsxE [Candidatus Hydromicrobium americanum]|nr:MAG: electron transport complex subunit RsxE [Candidatus Hydromicrobium americanum]